MKYRGWIRNKYQTCGYQMKSQGLTVSVWYFILSFPIQAISRRLRKDPTDLFTILELQYLSHDVPELHKIRRSPDRKALEMWKGQSGKVIWRSSSDIYYIFVHTFYLYIRGFFYWICFLADRCVQIIHANLFHNNSLCPLNTVTSVLNSNKN